LRKAWLSIRCFGFFHKGRLPVFRFAVSGVPNPGQIPLFFSGKELAFRLFEGKNAQAGSTEAGNE